MGLATGPIIVKGGNHVAHRSQNSALIRGTTLGEELAEVGRALFVIRAEKVLGNDF
jgi:hypothetical protein